MPARMNRQNETFIMESRLFLPRSPESIFPFFADAGNLEAITPPWLHFQILTPRPIEMHAGTIIEYRLRLYGIAMSWLTEITEWEPPYRFVDEQKRGPYRKWIHEHTFTARDGGCEMRDSVQYAMRGGWWVDRLFVRKNVRRIFDYRAEMLRHLFA